MVIFWCTCRRLFQKSAVIAACLRVAATLHEAFRIVKLRQRQAFEPRSRLQGLIGIPGQARNDISNLMDF
jgi:hypothetical protein